MPSLARCIAAYEAAAHVVQPGSRVLGISLNTSGLDAAEAKDLIATTGAEFGLPVGDPVRTGLDELVTSTLSQLA